MCDRATEAGGSGSVALPTFGVRSFGATADAGRGAVGVRQPITRVCFRAVLPKFAFRSEAHSTQRTCLANVHGGAGPREHRDVDDPHVMPGMQGRPSSVDAALRAMIRKRVKRKR